MPELAGLNLEQRLVITDRGEVLRITLFYDEFAEATDDPEAAVSFVAGPDKNGNWWAAAIREFLNRMLH